MNKIEKAKEIIEKYYKVADCGIYNNRNIEGDEMENLYSGNGLTVDICRNYEYFEVFGLTEEEFKEVENYYEKINRK